MIKCHFCTLQQLDEFLHYCDYVFDTYLLFMWHFGVIVYLFKSSDVVVAYTSYS